jgi:hypothetical protein
MEGSRAEMAGLERFLAERVPGRSNLEPWAGKRYGEDISIVNLILGVLR